MKNHKLIIKNVHLSILYICIFIVTTAAISLWLAVTGGMGLEGKPLGPDGKHLVPPLLPVHPKRPVAKAQSCVGHTSATTTRNNRT